MGAHGLLSLGQLLALGGVLLLVLGASSLALLRQDKVERSLSSRIDVIATPYARVNALVEARRERGVSAGSRALMSVAGLFGYHANRSDQYPLKAPLVLIFTFVAAALLAELASYMLGSTARLLIPLLWLVLTRKAFGWFEKRHASVLYSQFPDALGSIVRAVRVGIPVTEAVRGVAREAMEPTASEFMMLADQLSIGVPLDEALKETAARNGLQEYRFFATALSLQAQTGGGLSETLENLADVIRKRVGARKRAYALASEARTSTYVLAGLPLVTSGIIALVSPGYLDILFVTSSGNVVLAAAVGLLGTGMFAMRTIISKTLQ